MSLEINQDNKADNIIAYVCSDDNNKRVNNLCIHEDGNIGSTDIELNDGFKFGLAPRPVKEKERSVLFVAGESGAGKSFFVREYAKRYHSMFPKNQIYLISYLDRDETLDAYKPIIRLNCFTPEFLHDCPDLDLEVEFTDSLVLFDDIDCISDIKQKIIIYGLLNKMLRIGRHFNTSVAFIGHELFAEHSLKIILNESHSITWFPRALNYKKLKYLLEDYFGLSKDQIIKIRAIKDRSITYIKGMDKIILSEKQAFIM